MTNKLLVLITGANQGLGYYATQQLAATDKYHILLGSRDLKKGEQAIQKLKEDSSVAFKPENVEAIQIDMDTDESIQAAASQVEKKYGYLDILMLNAGISRSTGTTREQYQKIYNTNTFGVVVSVETFLPLLRKSTAAEGKRIAITSTSLASFELALNPPFPNYGAENFPIYRSSKSALNMIMCHYAALLGKEGFVVSANNPGYCGTNLNNYNGFKDPSEGAKALIRAAVGKKEEVHSLMINEDGTEPW